MSIERDVGDKRRRFRILDLGMGAFGFSVGEAPNPNICFITSRTESEEAPPGKEPDGKCSNCGMQNEDDAKFCDQCGKSMAAKSMEEAPPPSSKPASSKPESSEKAKAGHPPAPERMQAPAKMPASATLATILGAEQDTPLAIKTAAIQMRQERDWLKGTLAGITGKDGTREMIGAALNIPGRLAKGAKAAADLAELRMKQDDAERLDLAHRLNATGTVNRSKIFADVIDDSGARVPDANGNPKVRIRTRYATMDLDVFRGLVTDLEGDAPKQRRNPFEPNRDEAQQRSREARADGLDAAARLERAKKDPAVLRMFHAPGNTHSLDAIATQWVKTIDAQNGGAA